MNPNDSYDPATAGPVSPEVWSRHGGAMVVTTPPTGSVPAGSVPAGSVPAGSVPAGTAPGGAALGREWRAGAGDTWPDASARPEESAAPEENASTDWSSIASGPALALASFVFATAQAVSGFIATQAASLIPGAADSPANHVRVVAVIYAGLGCTGLAFAWLGLRRSAAEEPPAPRWATYAAAAAMVISILVVLQAGLLLMLSMLVPHS